MQTIDGLKELSLNVLRECEVVYKETNKLFGEDIATNYPANVLSIGEDKASAIYMKRKKDKFASIGLVLNSINIPYNGETEDEVITKLSDMTSEEIMMFLQFPVPKPLNGNNILNKICTAQKYDLDGLSASEISENAYTGRQINVPCTAAGILLYMYIKANLELAGKEVLIIGKSQLVGLPLADLLIKLGCSVTVVSSKVVDLKYHLKNKDFIVSAAGIRGLLDSKDIESKTTVIDVSINVKEDGKLCGDLEITSDNEFTYTPVPGGVGLMTTSMLVVNYLRSVLNDLRIIHDEYESEYERLLESLDIKNIAQRLLKGE